MLKLRSHLVWQFPFLLIVCALNSPICPQIKDPAPLIDEHGNRADTFTATFENRPTTAKQTAIKPLCQSPESAAVDWLTKRTRSLKS
jgi:hypothetical protein